MFITHTDRPETKRGGMRLSARPAVVGLLLVMAQTTAAFHVRMELQPDALEMGESAELVIMVQSEDPPGEPERPNIPGLRITGPRTEHTLSRTMINGVSEHRRFTTYRYTIIPLQPGEYTIGPITYTHANQTIEVPAQTLKVAPPSTLRGAQGHAQDLSDLVFARLSANKNQIYVHEEFILTIAIYSRGVNLGRDLSLMNMPDTGLSMQPFEELRATREIVDDQIFDVRRYQARIRPLTAGAIRFNPELRIQLLVPREERRGRSLFDDPFFRGMFSNMEAHPFDLELEPLAVVVRPLPDADRPNSFTGGVGLFDFSARATPAEVRPGDPITLSITIQGDGNMDTVAPPAIQESELFRVYPPRLTGTELNRAQSRGKKRYEQVIIPRSSEATEIPALPFSFFEPDTEQYQTITAGPFPLTMLEGDPSVSRVVRADDTVGDHRARIIGQDIVYLKPAPARWTHARTGSWHTRPAFLGLQTAPPILVLAVFVLARRRRALDTDIARARRYRAPRSARPGLRQAEKALASGSGDEFYNGMWAALTAYFGDRLNLPPGAVTTEEVQRVMSRNGLSSDHLDTIARLFAACDQRRFSGVTTAPASMKQHLDEFRCILKACERVKT